MTRWWTIALLIGFTLLLIAWDIYAVIVAPGTGTISAVVLDTTQKHPLLPFAIGVVCGHLLWPQPSRK